MASSGFVSRRRPCRECAARAAWAVILLLILSLAPLFPQTPQGPAPEGVIRITVNLVQVDAVVTDSKGRQATNLRPEDFEILEDDRPQTITNFSYIFVAAPAGGETSAQPRALPAEVPSVPPVRLRPEQVCRTIAIVVDDLGLSFESIVYARQALKKFVDEDVQPGDLVAILRTAGGLGALQQFTNDKRLLYAAIDRLRWRFERPYADFAPSVAETVSAALNARTDVYRGPRHDLEAAGARESESRQQIYSSGTLGALDYVVRGLRDLPGRKSVILLSAGWYLLQPGGTNTSEQQALQRLTDLANRSSVVMYTIDARGLPTLALTAEDTFPGGRPGVFERSLQRELVQRQSQAFESQGVMDYLAKQTGGLFIHDNNDLRGGLREAMDDTGGYYLIGYKPPADTFKNGKGDRGYHHIQVKVKVPGLQVRSRTGFYGIPDEETRPIFRTRDEQLRAAVSSPFNTAGIHVQLAFQFVNEGRRDSTARLWLHIDAGDLTFQDAPGGSKKGAVDVLALTFGDNGAAINSLDRTFTGSFQPHQLDALRNLGVNYRMDVPIKDPGGYQLRVAVRDAASQRVGSASQFIEVPDVRRGRLVLSGIVLNNGTLGEKGPAMRRFQAGDRVTYQLEIYNARRGAAGQVPNLESKVQVFRDGRVVLELNPGIINENRWNPARLMKSGELRLGTGMPSGEYVLQVTVTDKLAPREHSTASQWIDFEIVPGSGP